MLITKHIVSTKLVGLTPVLRPLFPYEFEIPASPSMYPGSGGNSRTGSPPASCPVRRIPRQDPLHTIG